MTPNSRGEELRSKVPEHLLGLLDKHMAGRGIGLRELAVVAAVLEHLIRADLAERVKSAHANYGLAVESALGTASLSPLEAMQSHEAVKVLEVLMAHYVSVEHRSGYSLTFEETINEMAEAERYVNWWKIKEFIREALGVNGDSKYDPAKPLTFEQVVDAAQRVSDQFEDFSTQECGLVRKGFLAMPGGQTGRVRLSHLHTAVLNGDGGFAESTEYLRKLGAVDDSDPAVPHVLLPNYMASPSNCLATTSFFDLCCPSECESIVE